ncbi:MAG: serine/threonine-protein kinase [Gemmatimonadales bacterium]
MAVEPLDPLQQVLGGQYEIQRELGRGGMGVVYLALEARLDRLVAVKVLPREFGASPELRERFLREARTAAQLSHPNIVPIFRADELGGFAFFTMGYIEGESLAERLRARGPLPPAETVRILRETAWALAYAHARGVVHRDIKPENIMIERGTNRVIVTDFGIARDQLATSLTQDGMVLGSVHYMSPEQASGDKVDGRSDLYSLGVVGFEVLSGARPFDDARAATVMAHQVTKPAPPVATVVPGLAPALAAVIDRCLVKDPDLRFSSGEALAEALDAALSAAGPVVNDLSASAIVATGKAQAIWLRAAQLQAEATSRLQTRYQESQASEADQVRAGSGGYRLRDVELAAVEAGIAPEYVALAIAERPKADAADVDGSSSGQERILSTMLGTTDRSISHSQVVHGTPRAVLEAIGRVFPAHPYALTLRDTIGGHPLDGGILVFEVPMIRSGDIVSGEGISNFSMRMTQIELNQLNVVLKPVGSPAAACEVIVYGDLRNGLRKNWRTDKWTSASAAAAGAASGTAIGVAALSLGALAALPALGGAALLGGLSLLGYRAVYRYALRRSHVELGRLLAAVESNVRAATVFGAPPPARSPAPRGDRDDGSSLIMIA